MIAVAIGVVAVAVTGAVGGTSSSGRASCVIDDYTTSKAHYRESACLVSGGNASAVAVAAAPSTLGPQGTATLERAISTFTT